MTESNKAADTAHNAEDAPKLTEWKKEPSVRDLKQDYDAAKVEHGTQIGKIESWLDNLFVRGSAKPKAVTGRSSVQPKLIRKQAEWRYSALSAPFLSNTDLFKVNPITFEDKERARQNELVLNHQFNTKINKIKFINDYVRAAVNKGTVICRVGWESDEQIKLVDKPVFEFVPASTQEDMQKLQLAASGEHGIDEEWQDAVQLSQEQGQPFVPVQTGVEPVQEVVVLVNRPIIEVCDHRNVVVDPTCKGDITKANFVIYSFETSLSEMGKTGLYKNLDYINVEGVSVLADPDHASPDNGAFTFNDKPRKKIVAYEYWGYWDIEGKGQVTPIVATWVGDVLVRMEENPFPDQGLPFVTIPYLPVENSIYGEPDGELIEDNQRIIGAVTRGMIDIMGRSANGQQGVRKDALDVTNQRKFDRGEDYQFNGNVDPRQAFHMHTYPEVPNSAQLMLQLQQNEADSLSGVKGFHSGLSGNALGDMATGIRGALDAASKRELDIMYRLKQGIVEIGRKILAMNAEFLSEEEVVRITNDEFLTVLRDDLAGEYDLELTITTAEEDNAKAQELAFMLQTIGPDEDPAVRRMILADICRLRKMPTLAEKIQNYQPEPDPVQEEMQMLSLEKLRAEVEDIRNRAREREANAGLTEVKVGTEQAKAENLQSDTDLKNLDFVEQEAGVKQERDLQKMNEQSKAQAKTKLIEHALKASA